MKKVLVLGAGRSSSALIKYLLDHVAQLNASITVGDRFIEHAAAKIDSHEKGTAIYFDAQDELLRRETVSKHDLIISLLPPNLHILVAHDCIEFKKPLITASYVNKEIEELNADIRNAGVLFMYEMGLDPGIDHMSAMKIIHHIQQQGGNISSFKSGTGGLVAPESDDNPWHYKVTWNPRNVVLAGQSTAQYLENGLKKFVPYHRLFSTTEKFSIDGLGKFESYPNRDSLQYISKYRLNGVKTILRSTLRKKGYCEAWNALVQLGLTDDSYTIEYANNLAYSQWLSSYLPEKKKHHKKSLKDQTAIFLKSKSNSKLIQRLEWLGLFNDEKIPLQKGTPAQILQDLIERKWMMKENDNDMIVMRHEIEYTLPENPDQETHHTSTLVITGEDAVHTAMAKTVGLPMAIMAKLILQNEISLTGLQIPVMPEVYNPVLKELEELGVKFEEKIIKRKS